MLNHGKALAMLAASTVVLFLALTVATASADEVVVPYRFGEPQALQEGAGTVFQWKGCRRRSSPGGRSSR
jgi:hypothetical protein